MRHLFYISIFWIQFSFEFIHLQSRTRYNIFLHRKKSYQLLTCRVAKNLPILELHDHFIKSSTVAYKRVANKKCIEWGESCFITYDYVDTSYGSKCVNINKMTTTVRPFVFLFFCYLLKGTSRNELFYRRVRKIHFFFGRR